MRVVPRSLFGRLILIQIVYGVLIVVASAWLAEYTHTRFHYGAMQTQAREWAAHVLLRNPELRTVTGDSAGGGDAANSLARLGQNFPGATFYVVDEEGRILSASVTQDRLRESTLDMAPVRAWLAGTSALPLMVADPLQPDQRRVFSAAVVREAAPTLYLLMVLEGPDVDGLLMVHADFILSDSMKLAAAVTVPALATTIGLLFMILRPIRRIRRTLAGMARTELESDIRVIESASPERRSELDQVSRDVDAMARKISDLLRRLKDDDRSLRDLYAALSHDLRTPLMVVKYNLDAFGPTGSSLPPADAEVILRSTSAQVRSLERMLEEQFELANLQRSDYCIQAEPFPVNELVREVVAKFAVRAAEHGVTVTFEPDLSSAEEIVEADVMLIERVLDNLIGNAIRHAKGASAVVVETRVAADWVEVFVADDGCGLPAHVAERLDGRSNAGSHGAGAGNPGSGLGLRVVARILELHRGVLVAARGSSGGTRIGFRLRRYAGR